MWRRHLENMLVPQASQRLIQLLTTTLLCIPLLHCAPERTATSPQSIDGLLDLQDWNPAEDGPISMAGQWRFAWQEMLQPQSIDPVWEKHQEFINAPQEWFGQAHSEAPSGRIPVMGYGTYLLRIKLPPGNTDRLSILFPPINDSAEFSITDINGQPVAALVKQGQTGKQVTEVIPIRTTNFREIHLSDEKEIVVWIQVANFHQHRGGMSSVPILGQDRDIRRTNLQTKWLASLLLGVLLISALYHLVLFVQRPQDHAVLFFALFCSAVVLRQTLMMRLFDHLNTSWGLASWVWTMRLEYASIPLMGVTAVYFVNSLISSGWYKQFIRLWSILGAILVGISLLASTLQFTDLVWIFQIHILAGLITVLIHVTVETVKGTPLAGWLLLSSLVLAVGAVNDVLHNQGIIYTTNITPYCFIAFVLFQSAITARNFSRAIEERDNLNLTVIQQTEQLAQESQARSQAEQDLRLEAESKVLLFSDAVHHLNNPINHIVGSIESISVDQADMRETLAQLFSDEDDNPEAQAVNQFFQKRFKTVARRIEATTHAVERASETIALLRALSGIDGISYQKTTVGEILALSWKRIGPFLEELDITHIDSHCDTQCVGHPGLYSQGLEIIVSNLSSNLGTIRSIRFLEAGQLDHHRIVVDLKEAVDERAWASRLSLIGYLLKPYKCHVRQTPHSIEFDVLADYTSAIT